MGPASRVMVCEPVRGEDGEVVEIDFAVAVEIWMDQAATV
jgi:hypothetical protein